MNSPFVLKTAAPTIVISGLLLALGIVAAWNVQRLQLNSSELIAREVHGMVAAQDLYIDMREIRHQLQQYGRSRDTRHLDEIRQLKEQAPRLIDDARKLVVTPQEEDSLTILANAWSQFSSQFELFANSINDESPQDVTLDQLIADITCVVDPAKEHLTLNRDVVDRTNETNRRTNDQLRQAFLLLGICGSASGLVAGLLFARGISRSIVQLDVSVRGAAGRLQEVVGPVTISSSGGFRELEAGLQEMGNHIGTVVERLQQRELEVIRGEQLAAVGQLAAGMAHELRNPLMPMKMLVQAAMEREDGSGLTGRPLKVVEQEIGRLEKAIQDFLDFARPPKLERTRLDVGNILKQTMELVSARAERQSISLERSFPADPLWLEADAGQLRQVVLNLLLNACDVLPEGGKLTVALQCISSASRSTAIAEAVSKNQGFPASEAVITIADSGPGLPPEIIDRIFEPFHSTKESGTGLGLSICRRIVEAHGGTIKAGQAKEGGALFTIRLPM